jgi:hypothetical protein
LSGLAKTSYTAGTINAGDIMHFKDDWFFVRDHGSWASTASKWKVRIITPVMVIEEH